MDLQDLAAIATAIGVAIAAWQLYLAKQQAQLAFEDSLNAQYRALLAELPTMPSPGHTSSRPGYSRHGPSDPCLVPISGSFGDVVPVHTAMRSVAAGKNVWLVGGGDLVGQFHDRGLLDEIILTVAPVTLGAVKPLLPRAITTPPLQLLDTHVYGPFVQLRYPVDRRPIS